MKQIYLILTSILLLVAATACEKDTDAEIFAPQVITGTATDIYRKGATLSGEIKIAESTIIDRYGILFSELQSMAEYQELPITSGETDFSMLVQNLKPGTTYYFCTYAHSGYSIVRGEVRSFTTSQNNAPIFDTPVISDVSESSFNITATLLDEGGSELMLSGFCYNEAGEEAPTFMDNVENVEISDNTITATITDLYPGKTYQIRAYGASSNGLAYSKMITVRTGEATIPFLSMEIKSQETNACDVEITVKLLEKGSAPITDCGFYFSTYNQVPTASDEVINFDAESDEYIFSLNGLLPHMTYYFRAYATNEYGTGYTDVISYTPEVPIAETAYLCYGETFNERIKQLANGNAMTRMDADSLIQKIEFKTGITSRPSENYVIVSSEEEQTPIYASFDKTNGVLTVSTPSNTIEIADASFMFFHLEALHSIDLGNFNITETTTDLSSMFAFCKSLTSLDVSQWDIKNVTATRAMFSECYKLTSLNVSNWNTSNITDMHTMFGECSALTSLDVSKWNTSKVTTMASMFFACHNLTSLNVSNWNTSNVTEMYFMFLDCYELTSLDVAKWDVTNVTHMAEMFERCEKLTTIDVSNWNTSNIHNMRRMFRACYELRSLDVSNWNTSNVTDMYQMFGWCHHLPSLNLSKWDISKVTDIHEMFIQCTGMTTLELSNWSVSQITNMNKLFRDCFSLTRLDISNWNLQENTEYTEMFKNCALESKRCEIVATQSAQDLLLNKVETTGMEPSYFIWVNANTGSDSSYENMPNHNW